MKKQIILLFSIIFFTTYNAQKITQEDKISQIIAEADSGNATLQIQNAKYLANEVNWTDLYASRYSSKVISTWVNLYTMHIKDIFEFQEDFRKISEKITNPSQYANFVKEVTTILNQQKQNYYISFIADWVRASGKIDKYDGILELYLKGAPGTQAPDLIIKKDNKNTILKSSELAKGNYNKTMLLFYSSQCGPCLDLLQKMPSHFDNMTSKGVKIISLSLDQDEKTFSDKAKEFQWKDAFCDYESINSINVQNYAVTGTPTILLLDKEGKIVLRTSSLEEILGYINN